MLAGFGPYVAVYLAEQKWTQENIGFVLTASGLAGLLALMPGGELLDTVRSKRALVALGASMSLHSLLEFGRTFRWFSPRWCSTEPLAPSLGQRSLPSASA
jgi:predicted MFS family arabinose efflux permease